MRQAFLLLFLVSLAAPALAPRARGMELELEENRAQNGTIGFIDLDRIFQEYPETLRAKTQFEAEVNEKRLDIERRKREVLDMKEQLADLEIQREELLKKVELEPAVVAAPAASTAAARGASVAVSTAAAQPPSVSSATTAGAQPSSGHGRGHSRRGQESANALPLEVGSNGALAGAPPTASTAPAVSAPAVSTAPLSAAATAAVPAPPAVAVSSASVSSAAVRSPALSTTTVVSAPAISTAALTVAATAAVALKAGATVQAAVPPAISTAAAASAAAAAAAEAAAQKAVVEVQIKELDKRIAALKKQIDAKQAAFDDYQAKVESDLRVMEKHRVKLLLGKIYDVVQEVAKEEGLSVVQDKKNILYGQDAVDLTDKVLARLKQE